MTDPLGRRRSSVLLEPPKLTTETLDPGAHELDPSSESEDHFSDASEGRRRSLAIMDNSRPTSPIPKTRVEKVDDTPSHGQVPGSSAYDLRRQDAVPDEIEIVPEGKRSRAASNVSMASAASNRPLTPGGTPIPLMVVEKVDPEVPSHGEVPGTAAYEMRTADAAPDLVLKAPEPGQASPVVLSPAQSPSMRPTSAVPETVVTRVDSEPAHGEVPGTDAWEKRRLDAEPDELKIEQSSEDEASPTQSSTSAEDHDRSGSAVDPPVDDDGFDDFEADNEEKDGDDGFGDDFDDFEEGGQDDEGGDDDDFGDFDDGFAEPAVAEPVKQEPPVVVEASLPDYPLPDFNTIATIDDLLESTESHLDALFPGTSPSDLSENYPTPSAIASAASIFLNDRSLSLWTQLVAPPPLQPPNWIKSRIRRLFLVSLGVPVDLDEILPASKQKWLVLPSIAGETPALTRLKGDKDANSSRSSLDSTGSNPKEGSGKRNRDSASRRRGPAPPPDLDLAQLQQLVATPDATLEAFTEEELKAHVQELEALTKRAVEVLEYWVVRRDGMRGEKEAYEGVIENLVKHARRVRK